MNEAGAGGRGGGDGLAGFWAEFKYPAWLGIWVLTRLFMVAQVGFWNDVVGTEFEDVNTYKEWSDVISSTGGLPVVDTWQYPSGAAFVLMVPRLFGDYFTAFVVLMVVVDLIGLLLTMQLGRREGRDLGVWAWLLAMPILSTLPLLRFDPVPTVIAMAMLVVVHRRPNWFGALAGIGASIKVWPLFLLLGEWDRRKLLRSALAAVAALVVVFAVGQIAFGDQTGFFTHQNDRGLNIESIAATPWQLREVVTGTPIPTVQRFGTNEVGSDLADAVSKALTLAALVALIAAALWWLARDRAIKRGAEWLRDEALARDYAFTVVLLFVVTSRVLSPQFMVWMVGMTTVVLSTKRTLLLRPALVVLLATALTAGVGDPAIMVLRNLALVVAVCDAAAILGLAVLRPSAPAQSPAPSEPPRRDPDAVGAAP